MRGGPVFWAGLLVLAALHFLLHVGFGIGREAPDLLTVAVLLGARSGGLTLGAAMGLVAGLMEDALSLLAFGSNAVALAVAGAVGSFSRELFVGESAAFVFIYLLAGKWLRDLLQWLLMGETLRGSFVDGVIVESGVAALYAAAVGTVVVIAFSGGLREARA